MSNVIYMKTGKKAARRTQCDLERALRDFYISSLGDSETVLEQAQLGLEAIQRLITRSIEKGDQETSDIPISYMNSFLHVFKAGVDSIRENELNEESEEDQAALDFDSENFD